MKLVYLWIQNHENRIVNQSFNISSAYDINFDIEQANLYIAKNNNYIENFYGKNILDVTAIVGSNGAGKTTFARFLYDYCESVHVREEDTEDTRLILIYEKEMEDADKSKKLIIMHDVPFDLTIKNDDVSIELMDLRKLNSEKFIQAEQEHDLTTVYFTNSFELNINQGFSEFSSFGIHRSLCYTPMLSLNRAQRKVRSHYGAEHISNGRIFIIVNQYAQKMTEDFKVPYAASVGYNYLIAVRYFPGALVRILPLMKDFRLRITEFGEYIRFCNNAAILSTFDKRVMFIRKNIYEHFPKRFQKNAWKHIYINVLCEIVLFLNICNDEQIDNLFEIFKKENIDIASDKAFERFLILIEDNESNCTKKELIRRIRTVEEVDLEIIDIFFQIQEKNLQPIMESKWYRQVQDFRNKYDSYKKIQTDKKIHFGFTDLIDLMIDKYNDTNTIYGRMFNIIPQPMSSGELAMINIFAATYSALKKKTSGNILLILDEIDAFLHPKWQQDIVTHITRWINESDYFDNKKIQLVLATHSPIILSDIPKDNIIRLKKETGVVTGEECTFGANIGKLFYDSFFLQEGSIGRFARHEIQWAIDNIDNKELNKDERKRMVYIVNNIGDKFLREKLKSSPIYIEMAKESRNAYGED